MNKVDPRRLLFRHWAMPVKRRRWAMTAVVLHRLQRMTVLSRHAWTSAPTLKPGHPKIHHIPGHSWINNAEWRAFFKAIGDDDACIHEGRIVKPKTNV